MFLSWRIYLSPVEATIGNEIRCVATPPDTPRQRIFLGPCCPGLAGGKVGGHVAVNFFIRKSFVLFMLDHSSKVGGQLADMPEPPTAKKLVKTNPCGQQN
jgi:hypothetical protein